jgi:hypothetical protein
VPKAKAKTAKAKVAPADNTAGKQRGRPFKPGVSGNPAGRPKGARNRFCAAMLDDYADLWREGGRDALRELRDEDPAAFVKAALHWVPREFDLGDKTADSPFLEAARLALAGHFNERKVNKHEDDDV